MFARVAWGKVKPGAWEEYERRFLDLMADRQIETKIDPDLFSVPSVLLCSEPTAKHCHRRLVVEYLRDKWTNVDVRHI